MLPFSFEDRFPDYAVKSGYGVTNEEPLLLRDLTRPFKRGLAIASAGEIAFFALLPRADETLVLVDHSYSSLRTFCLKALMLSTLGPAETINLLGTAFDPWSHLLKFVPMLPPRLAEARLDTWSLEPATINRLWASIDLASLQAAKDNLHKIKLIHGDLVDTADRAPYDLLYLSNALEHNCRAALGGPKAQTYQVFPSVDALSSLLTPDAQILWTKSRNTSSGTTKDALTRWPVVQSLSGKAMSWDYLASLGPSQPAQPARTA
jgi:hypothetical protein